jgi:hypothetical protein
LIRPGIAIAAALVLLSLLAGCTIGGDDPPRVPAAQREEISRAFADRAQRLALPGTGCFNVTRPVTPQTRRTYGLLVRVAREDPDAVLTSEDDRELSRSIRQAVAARARLIDTCVGRYPEADPSWAALSRGMWAALAEMQG